MTAFGYSALLVFSTFISSVSQVLLKKSADRTYESRIREYLNPLVMIAYLIFFASAAGTMWSYKVVSISLGAMLETSSYVFIFLFDLMVFREKANARKVIAVVLIIAGVVIANS